MVKPRIINKLKEFTITCVGWNIYNEDKNSSGTVLLGTSNSKILEASFESDEGIFNFSLLQERSFKVIYSFNFEENRSIDDIYWFQHPYNPEHVIIFIVTVDKIFQICGKKPFDKLFEKYPENPNHIEMKGHIPINRSVLQCFCEYIDNSIVIPRSIAWMTASGVVFADISSFSKSNSYDDTTSSDKILGRPIHAPYLRDYIPVSIYLTEFHYIVVYDNGIVQAISRINDELVFETNFDISSLMIGISHDPKTNITFVYNAQSIYEIHIEDEDRYVWAMYLSKQQFDLALKYCKNDTQRNIVWIKQGDHYYSQKSYELAATYYGRTSLSFEEASHKFIRIGEVDALRVYIKQKLEIISANNTERYDMKITMLCTFLIELYQDKLNQLEEDNYQEYLKVSNEFKIFLKKYLQYLDYKTVFDLLRSHGRSTELLYFAELIKDYDKVIEYHIYHDDYDNALSTFKMLNGSQSKLYYKYCSILMKHSPKEFVDILINIPAEKLEPKYFIPSLIKFAESSPDQEGHIIRYLEDCIKNKNVMDKSLHNFIISLYVKQRYETQLLEFVRSPNTNFDLDYAKNLCKRYNKIEPYIEILIKMGLYDHGIDIALKNNLIEIAKRIADCPSGSNIELSKKLWIKIIMHLFKDRDGFLPAMKIIQESNIVNFRDIINYFPNFASIDEMKQEICKSLQHFSESKEKLNDELENVSRIIDSIRSDFEKLKNKKIKITRDKRCEICKFNLDPAKRKFYVFNCSHSFHEECYIKKRSITTEKKKIIDNIKEKIKRCTSTQEKEELEEEIDDVIADDCILCGDDNIYNINAPIFDSQMQAKWKI